ncbi:sensor domain-containing diguanylate cyclase [Brevibacillus sp. SYSU BS000544]|uniref:sensor domain-containing diguanylate cyclase n=1 Tax=Brevibacillus sp. SYSU BS000544 TaxID=3416443 RepID=UPI003CE482E4
MPNLLKIRTSHRNKISLTTLLTGLVCLSVVLTMTILLIASYESQKSALIDTTLTLNYSSAVKMSQTVDSLFKSMRSSLHYSASSLAQMSQPSQQLGNINIELQRQSSNYFNSLVIVDENGIVRQVAPKSNSVGNHITTKEAKTALAIKKPYISKPYITVKSKRLIVFMSEPIFDKHGVYRGFIGGTIYLQEDNILNMIFGSNPHDTVGSSFYIVDSSGHLLYHPDKNRLGEDISANQVVSKLIQGNSGSEQLVNLRGEAQLAGYVKVPENQWGVVVVSPISVVYDQLTRHIKTILLYMLLPFVVLMLLVIKLARKLAKPFVNLADLVNKNGKENIELPEEEHHWNREADLLTVAIRYALTEFKIQTDQLTLDATTDPLTGLTNRRTLEKIMLKWIEASTPFSVIIMDIDRFKAINDNYGHLMGDEVLKHFANIITTSVRSGDICCRYGGEEFIALAANTTGDEAYRLAERIRNTLEKSVNPLGQTITVSLGIANHTLHSESPEELIQLADQALYKAKESGRNQTIIAERLKVIN